MLYDYIIIYDYKTEGKKKQRQHVHIGTLSKVPICNIHKIQFEICKQYSYKDIFVTYTQTLQRCPYKSTVYIFQIVFCVCCMYSTWHTVIDTFIYYFILFCFIIKSMFQELHLKSN